jgi:hypothetical protein
MAPPRLPQETVERLAALIAGLPPLTHSAHERLDFANRAHVPAHWLEWLEWRGHPHEFAANLMGSAANLVPAYDGPRQGCTVLGDVLTELIQNPAVAPADRTFMASLIVRYRLLPLADPAFVLPPAVRALLDSLPPQPPPEYAPSAMPSPPGGGVPGGMPPPPGGGPPGSPA